MKESMLCAVSQSPKRAQQDDPVWDDVTVLEVHGDLLNEAWSAVGFPDAFGGWDDPLDPPECCGLWVFTANFKYGNRGLEVHDAIWTQPKESEDWARKWYMDRRIYDIHRLTAAQMFNVAPEDVTKEQRGAGKKAPFAALYDRSELESALRELATAADSVIEHHSRPHQKRGVFRTVPTLGGPTIRAKQLLDDGGKTYLANRELRTRVAELESALREIAMGPVKDGHQARRTARHVLDER